MVLWLISRDREDDAPWGRVGRCKFDDYYRRRRIREIEVTRTNTCPLLGGKACSNHREYTVAGDGTGIRKASKAMILTIIKRFLAGWGIGIEILQCLVVLKIYCNSICKQYMGMDQCSFTSFD